MVTNPPQVSALQITGITCITARGLAAEGGHRMPSEEEGTSRQHSHCKVLGSGSEHGHSCIRIGHLGFVLWFVFVHQMHVRQGSCF